MPTPAAPPRPRSPNWGGARPGAGRPPGPSRKTLALWAYIFEWLGPDSPLLLEFSEPELLMAAAKRCFLENDMPRAAEFANAAKRADRSLRKRSPPAPPAR